MALSASIAFMWVIVMAAGAAWMGRRIDRLTKRLERIERRLGIVVEEQREMLDGLEKCDAR